VGGRLVGRLQASPYWPAFTHPVLRRVLPGVALSSLGDGMSVVAVAWLALRLAPAGSRGLWVGVAVAAYSLPGAAGAVALRRWLGGRGGARLASVNAALRAVALGLAGLLALAGVLGPIPYVCLLGASSLLNAWGMAGQYTLIAETLPTKDRVAGNTVFGLAGQLSLVAGPAMAGVLAALTGPAVVIVVDAATWAVLAVSYARIVPLAPSRVARAAGTRAPAGNAWRVLRDNRTLLGLITLSFFFYLLYGPVEVALPVHVASDLHGSAALLGTFWAVFGVGAVAGELAAPFLRRLPVWPTMIGIVLGWGAALVPLGLGTPLWLMLVAFCTGAVIWGPWASLSMALFQEASPPAELAQVLAFRGSFLIMASPLGTALGGPLVSALGARATLLWSAITTIGLGAVAAGTVAATARRRRPHQAVSER
jgi:MFS family permease